MSGNRWHTLWGIVLVTLILGLPNSSAQSSTAALRGRVTDPSGAVIPGAEVGVMASDGETHLVRSDAEGIYFVQGLQPGVYTVVAKAEGFEMAKESQVELSSSGTGNLDIELTIAVTGETINVGKDDQQHEVLGAIFGGRQVEVLPDSPELMRETLESLSRQTGGEGKPQIYVNGFPSDIIPPKSSIAEIRVNQDPYSAEYSDAGNGRIEIITKPGKDQFHGEASVVGTESALDTRNAFALSPPSYYSIGHFLSLGGPIGKRSSYHLDGGYLDLHSEAVVAATVLDSQYFPVEVNQSIPAGTTQFFINPRWDLQVGKSTSLNLLYDFTDAHTPNGTVGGFNLASQAIDTNSRSQQVHVGSTQTFGSTTVNETRFQVTRTTSQQTPTSVAPTLTIEGGFLGGGNNQGSSSNFETVYQARDTFSRTSGTHLFKLGAEANVDTMVIRSLAGFNGDFIFSSLNAYQITESGLAQGLTPIEIRAAGGGASQFVLSSGGENAAASTVTIAAFAEDTWNRSQNMSLTPGLRIESRFGRNGHTDIAPRFGFSSGLDGSKNKVARTRLVGGYGWSYVHFPIADTLQLQRLNGVNQQQYLVNAPDFFPVVPPVENLAVDPAAARSIYRVGARFRDSYTMEGTIGIRRELTKAMSAFFIYNNARSVDQVVVPNMNAPLPGTYNPGDPASGIRPLGGSTNIYEYQSEGISKANSLKTGVRIQGGERINLSASYAYTHATSDVTTAPSNSYDLQADYGRTASPTQTFLTLGQFELPHRIEIGSLMKANSGTPFNVVLNYDLNGDGQFNDRPTFATDLARPSLIVTPWGTFDTIPIAGQRTIPFNYGTGSRQFSADLYLSKRFPLGGTPTTGSKADTVSKPVSRKATGPVGSESLRSLQLSISGSNVFNIVNRDTPLGTLGSPQFGRSTTAQPGRSILLQAQLKF